MIDPNRNTTVIVDFSVCIHQLHNNLTSMEVEKEHIKAAIQANMVWLHSGLWLEALAGKNLNILYVTDSKPYWRTEYLTQEEVYTAIADRQREAYKAKYPKGRKKLEPKPIHYKGGRKYPDYSFGVCKKAMLDAATRNEFSVLSIHGYEADDLAAALVMTNRGLPEAERQNIVLATVDTDWMGLIDNNTTWFCLRGYDPRIRYSMSHINEWSKRRLGVTLDQPSDIWTVKTTQGDASDNLPPGSPLEVISLIEPPQQHRLWLNPNYSSMLKGLLTQASDNTDRLPVQAALNFLRKLGVNRFISPYQKPYAEVPTYDKTVDEIFQELLEAKEAT